MVDYSVGDAVTILARITQVNDQGEIYVEARGDEFLVCEDDIVTHTKPTLAQRLAGLTEQEIEAALARKDSGLAEAFEAAGTQIAKARRDAGDLKRRPKGTPTGGAAATAPPHAAGEAHPVPTGDDTPAADSGPEPDDLPL